MAVVAGAAAAPAVEFVDDPVGDLWKAAMAEICLVVMMRGEGRLQKGLSTWPAVRLGVQRAVHGGPVEAAGS